MNRIFALIVTLLAVALPSLASRQDSVPQVPGILSLSGDSVTLSMPDSVRVSGPRQPRTASPVDIDDRKRQPVLHYYDKHGQPLAEPVLFLATLDTVTKPKSKPTYPLYNGVSLGINFADAIMAAFGQKYGSYDIAVDVSLHNWFFPVIEAGIGYADATPDNRNFSYHVSPSFYAKIGLNYNFLYKSNPDYQVYAGLRAAMSGFSWSLTGVDINSSYWQDHERFDMTGMRSTAWWGEVLAGIKVRIVSNFSLGWSVRWHFPFNFSKATPKGLPAGLLGAVGSKPWFVPGYGGSGSFTFSFSAIWTIPAPKKPEVAPAEVTSEARP